MPLQLFEINTKLVGRLRENEAVFPCNTCGIWTIWDTDLSEDEGDVRCCGCWDKDVERSYKGEQAKYQKKWRENNREHMRQYFRDYRKRKHD